MTVMPMYKRCPKCKRRYSWNPDAGNMWCPYCGPLAGLEAGNMLWNTIKKTAKWKKG